MKLQDFYGNYSSGANAIIYNEDLDFSNYFSQRFLKPYKIEIRKNISRMKLKPSDLKNKNIMNVGTGREALAFLQFKPKYIFHYDISRFQVGRMKEYIKKKKISHLISSKQLDLSKNPLPKKKFDFIYLHGIIQHTDHPGKTLANLIYALKKGGNMWFFFSRSGTLIRFIGEMQRRLTKFLNIDDFYLAMKIIENALFKDNKFSDSIMDSSYVPNQNLFTPKPYIKFLKENNIKIYGDSLLFKNIKKNYDHIKFHEAVILFVKKIQETKVIKKSLIQSLSPNKAVDQLGLKNYKSNQKIKKIINSFNSIEKKIESKPQTAFALVYFLEKLKIKYYDEYLNGKKTPKPSGKFGKYSHCWSSCLCFT